MQSFENQNQMFVFFSDAYIITLMDTLTSVFAGFVVFAILGVMAKEANMEVQDVVSSSKQFPPYLTSKRCLF